MTKVRVTSRAAYDHLVASGQLVGKQRQCLNGLIEAGKATSGEVLAAIGIVNINAWRARFTELSARGLIREVGERRCKISGRLCLVWEATSRTKPMDRKKGARASSDLGAWKLLARRLAAVLAGSPGAAAASAVDVLRDYRSLAGLSASQAFNLGLAR